MIGTLLRDDKNNIITPVSSYQPPEAVKNLTLKMKQDYEVGHRIQNQTFREFNDMSLLQRMDVDQKAFNSYVLPQTSDPNEQWRWNGVRPITRNKVISIAAHLVAAMLYPNVFAQNDRDEEDRQAANVMRMMIEWNIKNSDYETSFLYVVIAALVNPVAYFHADFSETLQKVKQRQLDGSITLKEEVDEVMSGFHAHVVPADEILIANAYQFHLQKQRFIWRRRYIDFDEAKAKYGGHSNFEFVRPGIKAIFNEEDGTFYDQHDDELETLTEEATYYNRLEDVEITFVNGIYMGDDNVDANSIKHRDNKNRPKYPYAKVGFEPIDEKRFFFYKSQVAKMADDQELYDRMYQMIMDGTFLEIMPSLIISGGENIDTNVIFPGAVTNMPVGTTVNPITGRNLAAGITALKTLVEPSIDESSQSPTRAGQQTPGSQTAFEIARLEQNARTQLGIFGRMMMQMIKDFGGLMIDIILHNQSVGQVEEVLGGTHRMKFRTFLLPDQVKGGKKVTKKIQFDASLMSMRLSTEDKEEKLKESFKVFKEQGGEDAEKEIYKVNPRLFSRLKFLIVIEADQLLPKNEMFEKATKLEAYQLGRDNQFIDQEAWTREFLIEPLARGESDKFMRKEPLPVEAMGAGGRTPTPVATRTAKKEVMTNLFGSQ